jgi:hypothetical protein
MYRNPVHVVFPRRVFPFPAVIRKVDFLDEFPKLPRPVGVPLCTFICNDFGDFLTSLALGHLIDQANDFALSLAIGVPHADPAAMLFSDTSC